MKEPRVLKKLLTLRNHFQKTGDALGLRIIGELYSEMSELLADIERGEKPMRLLIGLTGRARSGKDTVAEELVLKYEIAHYWFSKPMKDAAKIIFNWTDAHVYGELKDIVDKKFGVSPRHALQTIGTDWGREMINDKIWLIAAENAIKLETRLVISDVRFDNEAEFIQSHGGVIVRINRPDLKEVQLHKSEDGVSDEYIDHEIDNDGTLTDLYHKVDQLMSTLLEVN